MDVFLAVAEEEHFGRAAKRLGMSQPPLTEQIKILESSLKLKLFDRSRRGTKLSAAGKAIYPEVRKFADYMASLERVVYEVAQGQSGFYTSAPSPPLCWILCRECSISLSKTSLKRPHLCAKLIVLKLPQTSCPES
ncbi:LysR family transcriptional regulator [Vibrio sinaloensis]|nr:LysR family transcriptional regulator [Vibrio sinaloensis]